MNQLQEKRRYARHACGGSIALCFTHRHAKPIAAKLLNLSQAGLSFVCDQLLAPGTTIIVRASDENYRVPVADADIQLRTMGFAMIKWCKDNSTKGRTIHQMGAVYLMP